MRKWAGAGCQPPISRDSTPYPFGRPNAGGSEKLRAMILLAASCCDSQARWERGAGRYALPVDAKLLQLVMCEDAQVSAGHEFRSPEQHSSSERLVNRQATRKRNADQLHHCILHNDSLFLCSGHIWRVYIPLCGAPRGGTEKKPQQRRKNRGMQAGKTVEANSPGKPENLSPIWVQNSWFYERFGGTRHR